MDARGVSTRPSITCAVRMTMPTTYQAPPELIAFATREAMLDADRVGEYLRTVGCVPARGKKCPTPRGVLLDLGAVLRLRAWDAAGVTAHIEAGLPGGATAMNDLIVALWICNHFPRYTKRLGTLAAKVFQLHMDRFAWTADEELGTEVVLDAVDDDRLVEAVAQFLLRNAAANVQLIEEE